MLTLLRMAAARLHGFLRPGDLDSDFQKEIESHLKMAEDDKIRQGMSPQEARRLARVELGNVTQLREAAHEARGLPLLDTFWLDLKLSLRMLRKSWGLTLIGGLALTIVITVGVIVSWLLETSFSPSLPLEDGDRVVAIQTWDDKGHRVRNSTFRDIERWREKLRSLDDIGAFRSRQRNLAVVSGAIDSVTVAEMTASGFQLARTPPLLGRALVKEDEEEGATPVVVIGHDAWQSRFWGDPAVVGQTVYLDGTKHDVVGVMPEGFLFPVSHSFWTPLRIDSSNVYSGDALEGITFARLGAGVTMAKAQSELAALGLLSSSPGIENEPRARARVVPYAFAFVGDVELGEGSWFVGVVLFLIVLLLVPPSANVAILVYARTITRQEEFAARFALGASRTRIVAQLFIEILVLASLATAAALLLANLAGVHLRDLIVFEGSTRLPFWIDFSLSFRSILFAAGLALVGAAIAGAIPALKATGRQMESGFRALGSRTGVRLGGTWTFMVVVQVTLTLAALPIAVEMGWGTVRQGLLGPGFAAEQFLTARIELDRTLHESSRDGALHQASRFDALLARLSRKLEAEPGVLGVTTSTSSLGAEPWGLIEVDDQDESEESVFAGNSVVRFNKVDDSFFEVFEIPFLVGQTFESGDFGSASNSLIVNQTFVRQHLGEGNPLGRRVRYRDIQGADDFDRAASEAWYEVVGVVADRPAHAARGTVYHPSSGGAYSASLSLRLGVDPVELTNRLREISMGLDPRLRVEDIKTLDKIYRDHQFGNNIGALALVVVTSSVLLLSAAGIYALMSFTVNQRRREIGIRSALGAQPRRLLMSVFNRALLQIGSGALFGALIGFLVDDVLPIEEIGGGNVPGIIPASVGFMLIVGLLASLGPARRGLRVDPIEELRQG